MKAMLEARMVATNIHGCASFLHGSSVLPERIAVSSQGVFIRAMDASRDDGGSFSAAFACH
jgi:hypothetical protein